MADVTVTAANVQVGTSVNTTTVVVEEAVTAGDVLVKNPTVNTWRKANSTTLDLSGIGGSSYLMIALANASTGQRVPVVGSGNQVTIGGSALTAAAVYVVSINSGKIAPLADLASTRYLSLLGYALDANTLVFLPNATGVVKP